MKQIKECEAKIEECETKLAALDEKLMDPDNASDMKLVNEYTVLQDTMNKEMERWEDLSMQLESLK